MSKRVFDFICASIGIFLLLPFFAIIAIWIKCDSKGPVFFRQERVGRNGKIFRIHKFRSMFTGSEDASKITVGDDTRITPSGRFIRKYKIDELPQLIDVFYGKMSLVGPRPEVQEFIDLYPDDVRTKVLSVRPGITDRASIEMIDENEVLAQYGNPRDAYITTVLPVKQKFYLDYVDHYSFLGDLIIILATVKKILMR